VPIVLDTTIVVAGDRVVAARARVLALISFSLRMARVCSICQISSTVDCQVCIAEDNPSDLVSLKTVDNAHRLRILCHGKVTSRWLPSDQDQNQQGRVTIHISILDYQIIARLYPTRFPMELLV
jgi:hypothetical protein